VVTADTVIAEVEVGQGTYRSLIDGVADRLVFTPSLTAQTIDLQLREGSPLTGGSALSKGQAEAGQPNAFLPVGWSLLCQGSGQRRGQIRAVPNLLIAGLSFAAGALVASRRASRKGKHRAVAESSRIMAREIAEAGRRIIERGGASPFAVLKFRAAHSAGRLDGGAVSAVLVRQ
jgi:hypothetical protein